MRAVLGDRREHQQGQEQRNGRQTDHILPAENQRQAGGEQRGQDRAGIAGPRETKRGSLMFRWVPGRCHGQCHGEGCSRQAKHAAHQQGIVEAMNTCHPGGQQAQYDEDLGADPNPFWLVTIHQQAQYDPQHRARQYRSRHHQSFVSGGEMQILAD